MKITVFTQPSCLACKATTRHLKLRGADFQTVDLSTDQEALDRVRNMGFSSAPVVLAGEEWWSGYRPDRLDAIT